MKMAGKNSLSILDSIYSQAMSGLPGSESVKILAEDYLSESGSLESRVNSLINWQVAKCSATGFLTGLGGLITLPVTIPADVGVNLYVQVRMSAAIAYMGGYEIYHDKVKTMVYLALAGNAANEVFKEIGTKTAVNFIKKKISGSLLKQIQKKIATKILGNVGAKGASKLVKIIPVVGGIVGAGFDGVTTKAIGTAAKKLFIDNRPPIELTRIISEDEVPDWAKNSLSR